MANEYQPRDMPSGYLGKWQAMLDRIAVAYKVPAALVTRVWPEQLEVLLSSLSDGNPYEKHVRFDLGTGLYCEAVMASRKLLAVPNALEDPAFCDNPNIGLNMISYLGVPLIWPDDSVFGTLCVADSLQRNFSPAYKDALWKVKGIIEQDFEIFCKTGLDKSHGQAAEELESSFRSIVEGLRGMPPDHAE